MLGLEQTVTRLRGRGLGYITISKELQREGHLVSFMCVKRFLDSSEKTAEQVIRKREDFQIRQAELTLKQKEQGVSVLGRALTRLAKDERIAQKAEENGDDYLHLQAADRVRKSLEFVARLQGQLQPGKMEVTSNMNVGLIFSDEDATMLRERCKLWNMKERR